MKCPQAQKGGDSMDPIWIVVAIVVGSIAISIPIWVVALRLSDVRDYLFKIANMLSGIFMKLEHIKFELFSISSHLAKKNKGE
jgi:hypothetical protein